MSTPAWKKRLNKEKQMNAKLKRDYEKMFEPNKNYKKEFKPLKWNPQVRETRHIPSLDSGNGFAARAEPKKYTGDLIVGIATMHKSNAVPVMKGTSQAEDLAHMRR